MSHALTFGETPTSDDILWGVIGQLAAFFVPIIGSLVVYLIHKDKPFVAYHAAQGLGLQITAWVAAAIISVIAGVTCGLGAILYVCVIPLYFAPLYGAWQAYNGEWTGYPLIGKLGR